MDNTAIHMAVLGHHGHLFEVLLDALSARYPFGRNEVIWSECNKLGVHAIRSKAARATCSIYRSLRVGRNS
jgi:hypothetical protein